MVLRLVRRIRKVCPTDDISTQAIDYLKRLDLPKGSPLRDESRRKAEIERLKAERDGLRAALRQIWFLDHNERDWESVDEIKAFAKDTLKREGE